jgi:ABC-type dipeptide/oligopeptide/nickel transport system permease subunit
LPDHKNFLVGSGLIGGTPLAALTSFFYPAQHPLAGIMTERLRGPSIAHGFATDQFGQDVLSRVMLGASDAELIRCHVLFNVMSPLLVQATISLPNAILDEVGLSSLALGMQSPHPRRGYMLKEAL